jgi:hypothetical protein
MNNFTVGEPADDRLYHKFVVLANSIRFLKPKITILNRPDGPVTFYWPDP